MRAVFGILSVLIVLAVVGLLAKKQLSVIPEIQTPALAQQADAGSTRSSGAKSPELSSQQIQEHVRKTLEAAMQRPKNDGGE